MQKKVKTELATMEANPYTKADQIGICNTRK
jgi:hypothetical protein